MKILCPNLDMIDISCDGWDNTEEQCTSHPLWSLQKQNSWVKRSENNMKDIIGISIIACLHFRLG